MKHEPRLVSAYIPKKNYGLKYLIIQIQLVKKIVMLLVGVLVNEIIGTYSIRYKIWKLHNVFLIAFKL